VFIHNQSRAERLAFAAGLRCSTTAQSDVPRCVRSSYGFGRQIPEAMSADGTMFCAVMFSIRIWNISIVRTLIKRDGISYLTYDAVEDPTAVTDLPWHIVSIGYKINL
jgi:hypothetical protein